MKVKDLQENLSKLDPEMEILCYSEDAALLPKDHLFRILEIGSVDVTEGEKCRGDDGIPSLKLGNSQHSQKYATINVISEF